jgi:hypothetical protein
VAEPARAAPVPEPNIHPAAGKRKGSLAPFTSDRPAPRGSLGCAAGDLQRLGGKRVALAPRRPGLPPRPVRPTRGAWPGARLRAAPRGPRASAGAASRASSGPLEVEARPQRSLGVLPRATLTERPVGVKYSNHPCDLRLRRSLPPVRSVGIVRGRKTVSAGLRVVRRGSFIPSTHRLRAEPHRCPPRRCGARTNTTP